MHLYATHKSTGEAAHIHIRNNNIIIWRNGKRTESNDFTVLGEYRDYTNVDRIERALGSIVGLFQGKEKSIQQAMAHWSREEAIKQAEDVFQKECQLLKTHIATLHEIVDNYQPYERFEKAIYRICFFVCASILVLTAAIIVSNWHTTEDNKRYIKTGSKIVDTKTNQILLYKDGEWDWVELPKQSDEAIPARHTKKSQLRDLEQAPFSDSQYYQLSIWVTQKGASWKQIRNLLKKGYNYDMICYELETLE